MRTSDPRPRHREGWLAVRAWAREPARPGLVSIVIPVFNGADFLHRALQSVLAQEYAHWEAIVVDDGSSDDSRSIAEAVAGSERRVRVIRQLNAGHAAARNRGLIACSGQFLQFLDADDTLCPRKLRDQVAYLSAHPRTDIVTGEARYFSVLGRVTSLELAPLAANSSADLLLRNALCVNSPLTRRRVLARTGGFKSLTRSGERVYGCEDWDLWLRAALAGCEIAHVPGVVVHNYWHAKNTQRDRVRMLESAIWALLENAAAVSLRDMPWWAVSLLEKRLALWVARHGQGTRAHGELASLPYTLRALRDAVMRRV